MKLKFLPLVFILSFLFIATSLNAQERKCAANDVMEKQISQNPSFAARMIAIEKHTQEFIASKRKNNINGKKPDNPGGGNGGGNPPPPPPPSPPTTFNVVIPVVVHVVYKTSSENISDVQVAQQIQILNDDFAALNNDINSYIPAQYNTDVSGNTGIGFCLVQTKRVLTSISAFSTNDAMKYTSSGGSDAVDPTKYLNIWVCNMSGGILGYAQFPGGNVSSDGIVVLYDAFGKTSGDYNLGRTATHEVGHYFNLRHIWGDRRCGNDLVDDTPLHDGPNYRCPAEGATSNCKGPIVEMWMNYMDYTYDKCMYMFSKDQSLRMQATLVDGGPRFSMVQSNPCATLPAIQARRGNDFMSTDFVNKESKSFQIYPTITSGNIFIQISASKTGVAELVLYTQSGKMVSRKRISVVEGVNTQEINIGNFTNGLYIAQLIEGDKKHIQKLVIQR